MKFNIIVHDDPVFTCQSVDTESNHTLAVLLIDEWLRNERDLWGIAQYAYSYLNDYDMDDDIYYDRSVMGYTELQIIADIVLGSFKTEDNVANFFKSLPYIIVEKVDETT